MLIVIPDSLMLCDSSVFSSLSTCPAKISPAREAVCGLYIIFHRQRISHLFAECNPLNGSVCLASVRTHIFRKASVAILCSAAGVPVFSSRSALKSATCANDMVRSELADDRVEVRQRSRMAEMAQ